MELEAWGPQAMGAQKAQLACLLPGPAPTAARIGRASHGGYLGCTFVLPKNFLVH